MSYKTNLFVLDALNIFGWTAGIFIGVFGIFGLLLSGHPITATIITITTFSFGISAIINL